MCLCLHKHNKHFAKLRILPGGESDDEHEVSIYFASIFCEMF